MRIYWSLFILMLSCVRGYPIQSEVNFENTTRPKTLSRSRNANCSENCNFKFNDDSLEKAKETVAKFQDLDTSDDRMLLYLNLKTPRLRLEPDDQKILNSFLQWQWTDAKLDWYLRLPIDLGFTTFHLSTIGEKSIDLEVDSTDSGCCYINQTSDDLMSSLLWNKLFDNSSNTILCNRCFEGQKWKTVYFIISLTWIGYDLSCRGSNNEVVYKEKLDSYASWIMPILCLVIALYHPLVYKIIESKYVKNHLKKIAESMRKNRTISLDYLKGDSPYGYLRALIKTFFVVKFEPKEISIFTPAYRLSILVCLCYFVMLEVPLLIEWIQNPEELNDFPDIYKLGLPILNWIGGKQILNSVAQIFLTGLILICICFAKCWAYKHMSIIKSNADEGNSGEKKNQTQKEVIPLQMEIKFRNQTLMMFTLQHQELNESHSSTPNDNGSESNQNESHSSTPSDNVSKSIQDNKIAKRVKFLEEFSDLSFYQNTLHCRYIFPAFFVILFTFVHHLSQLRWELSKKQCIRFLLFLVVDCPCCFLLYIELSVVTFIVRSAIYTMFIVFTNFEHLTRYVIFALTCIGYIGFYALTFWTKFKKFLEQIFYANGGKDYVPERQFKYVLKKCHLFKEQFNFLFLKIILTIIFFALSIAILWDSKILDRTKYMNNIIELVVVVITPHYFLKCFEKDTDIYITEHENDIQFFTKKYDNEKAEESCCSKNCCKNIFCYPQLCEVKQISCN